MTQEYAKRKKLNPDSDLDTSELLANIEMDGESISIEGCLADINLSLSVSDDALADYQKRLNKKKKTNLSTTDPCTCF